MVSLELSGNLHAFDTFPHKDKIEQFKNPETLSEEKIMFLQDFIHQAERMNRPDWKKALQSAIELKTQRR